MSSIVSLNEDYTQAAIALFGNTKPYLGEIKNIGGIFNARLKHAGSTAPGWIFPKTKLQVVKQLVNKINSGEISPQEVEEKKEYVKESKDKKEKTRESSDKNVVLSREEFMYIMNTLNRLDQEVNELKRKINPEAKKEVKETRKVLVKQESSEEEEEEIDDDDEEEEEEEVKPQKKGPSLLRRK